MKRLISSIVPFFPPHYRQRLKDLSTADNWKLASALAALFAQERAEAFFPAQNTTPDTENNFSHPITESELSADLHEMPSARENTGPAQRFPDRQNNKADPVSFQKSFSPRHPQLFSDAVISAAFLYKWSLEYAAALPEQLLKRCLEIAEHPHLPSAAAETLPVNTDISADEISRAAARGAEAYRRFCSKCKKTETAE